MKKNRILLRRVIAALLTLMLVFSSSCNMFSTVRSAAAEGSAAAEKPDDGENVDTGEEKEDSGNDEEEKPVTDDGENQATELQTEEKTASGDGEGTPKTGDEKENANTDPAEPQDSAYGKDSPGTEGNEQPSGNDGKEEQPVHGNQGGTSDSGKAEENPAANNGRGNPDGAILNDSSDQAGGELLSGTAEKEKQSGTEEKKEFSGTPGGEKPSGTEEKEVLSGTPSEENQTGTEEKEELSGTPGGEEQNGTEEKEELSGTPGGEEQNGTEEKEELPGAPGGEDPAGTEEKEELPGNPTGDEPTGTEEKEELSDAPGGEDPAGTEEKEEPSGTPGGDEQTDDDSAAEGPGTEKQDGEDETAVGLYVPEIKEQKSQAGTIPADGTAETEIPGASATENEVAFSTSGLSGFAATAVPVLQDMADKALAAAETLTGIVQVVLSKGTTYEGDLDFKIGDREKGDDFALELTAEDAGDDGMQGEGRTVINGNITIRGIRVIMNSIILDPDKKLTVTSRTDSTKAEYKSQGGELILNGSKNFPNEMSIVVGNNSSATITTTDNDDIITIATQAGAKAVTISTGEGVDTVNATLAGGNIDISTGIGDDKLNLNITGTVEQVRADAGDNVDEVTVVNNGRAGDVKWVEVEEKNEVTQETEKKKKQAGGIIIRAGAGDDTISVDVRDNAGSMTLDTGEGGDTVSVTKGDHFTLENVDYDKYTTNTEAPNLATAAVLTIENADRSDRITIDASTALAIKGIEIIGSKSTAIRNAAKQKIAAITAYNEADLTAVSAEDPGASVYLKGSLAEPGKLENQDPITWIDAKDHAKGFRLHTTLDAETTKNDYTLDITGSAKNNYTDTLKNKKTVELTADGTSFAYHEANQDFVNYVLKSQTGGLTDITMTGAASPLTLSNIVLDAEQTQDDDDRITVNNLTAENMNALFLGKQIEIKGTVRAQNVRAESAQGTVSFMGNLFDIGEQDFGDTLANSFSAKDSAEINVNGTIEAAQDIALVARVKHSGGLITFLPTDINLINVKIADAVININKGAKLIASQGNATAEARIKTTTGYEYDDTKQQESPVKDGMFLAVTIIVNHAAVTVENGARIDSGADVVLHSQSDVKAATYANSSENIPSPVDVALTVISNQVRTLAQGEINAGRKVQLSATGTVQDENVATGAVSQGALSGGYISVNIVDQDVEAIAGSGAVINAGGNLRIATRSVGNATTKAVSGGSKPEDAGSMSIEKAVKHIGATIFKTLWEKIRDHVSSGNQDMGEKVQKMLSDAAEGNYSVKLIKLSDKNDAKGTATVTTEKAQGGYKFTVTPKAKSGCRVEKVRYRYLTPGSGQYTYADCVSNGDGTYSSDLLPADVEVIVIYAGEPDGKDADDNEQQPQNNSRNNGQNGGNPLHVNNLLDDAAGMGDNAEDEDSLEEDEDGKEEKTYQLVFEKMTNGAVVTWRTNDQDGNLTAVHPGDEVRLVPNPGNANEAGKSRYVLRENSLTVTYKVPDEKDEKKLVTRKDVVTKDDQGRYIFVVPKDVASTEIKVSAEFIIGDESEQEASHRQATGAIAIGVLNNDSQALIEEGTVVNAGGQVDMFGFKMNRNTTVADGTAIESGAGASQKKDREKTVQKSGYSVGGAEFALRVNSNVSGAVTSSVNREEIAGASDYHPRFEMNTADAAKVEKIVLSYYSKLNPDAPSDIISGRGTRRTVTLTRKTDGDGKVTYEEEGGQKIFDAFTVTVEDGKEKIKADLVGLGIKNGTVVDVSFVFAEPAQAQTADSGSGSQQYLIPNPIRISYNKLKKDNTEISMGTVTFQREKDGRYYFRVEPDTDHGYTIDDYDPAIENKNVSNQAVLYASWLGADGMEHKAPLLKNTDDPLHTGNNIWYFDPTAGSLAVPSGAVVTINAVFRKDEREIQKDGNFNAKDAHGDVTIGTAKAKRGDTVELKLTPEEGYAASAVKVQYFAPATFTWKELDASQITLNRNTGEASFTMPPTSDAENSHVRITPVFEKMDVDLGKAEGCDIAFEGGDKTFVGARVVVTSSQDGYKVTGLIISYNNQTEQKTIEGDSFTVPELPENDRYVKVQASVAPKAVPIEGYKADAGKVTPVSCRADGGEKVIVKVEPAEGYRVKTGTLKAVIQGGSESTQIVLKRQSDGTYAFTMPSDAGNGTSVTLRAEFEPGSEGVKMSLGVSVAAGIMQAENNVEIRGGKVSAAKGYSMIGLAIGGKAITEAKAGYSQGDIGVAGALGVQVAESNINVKIHKDDNGSISLKEGSFFLLAKGKQDFKLTADAAGKDTPQAGTTGVGAGIAVAINKVQVAGEIEDGVKLTGYGDQKSGPAVKSININVGQKYKDETTAKAGAVGGSSFVPVAAVNVSAIDAKAYMGRLDLSELQKELGAKPAENLTAAEKDYLHGILNVDGKVKIKSAVATVKAEYNHTVSADASARGGKTAVGGAFAVTVLEDSAESALNQSINAKKEVSVTASTGSAVKAVAKAAVSGGVQGGKGGADKQANKMLGGAGDMAGKYGGMDGNRIKDTAGSRQLAETGENTVSAAGAFVLNVQKGYSRAEILNGVDVTTGGKLEVRSSNRTDGTIKADASATKSNTGVGVGIAINIVDMDNIARIGDGFIQAVELLLSADIASVPGRIITKTVIENAGALKTAFQTQIEEAINSIIPESIAKPGGVDLTRVVATFASTAASKLIKDMGLDKLISLNAGSGIGAGFANAAEVLWERIKAFPQTLAAPFVEVFEEFEEFADYIADQGGSEYFETFFKDLLGTAAIDAVGDGWETIVGTVLKDGGSALLGNAIEMVTGKMSGKGWDSGKVKESLKTTFTQALSEFKDKVIDTAINKMSDQMPFLNQANIKRIKELKNSLKEKTAGQMMESLWQDIDKTFREQVYDYETYLIKYSEGSFAENIKKELISCLKDSTVAATNELIDQVAGALDVRFEKEPKDDRHVITTQAVSGAGAKETSGAGSAAIAVVNLNTVAEIADSTKGIRITGNANGDKGYTGAMVVSAEELRRIRTHATAAVDGRGEADNNDGKGTAEESNTADSGVTVVTVPKSKVTVNVGVGGSAEFERVNEDTNPVIWITPGKGYTIREGEELDCAYKLPDNDDEEKCTVTVHKKDGKFYIQPFEDLRTDLNKSYGNLEEPKDLLISVNVKFDEVLHAIPAPKTMDLDDGNKALAAEAVSVGVQDRGAENNRINAREGETVKLTVDHTKLRGHQVDEIAVTYKNGKGEEKTLLLGNEDIALYTSNRKESVYVFQMPGGDIKDITVKFKDGEDERADNEATDAAGRSIGVGAAFTFAYGESTVKAAVGKRGGGVAAGTLAVTADLEHEQENYATAGTDPFEGTANDSEKEKGIDASVSVFMVDNDVTASVAKGTAVKTNGDPGKAIRASWNVNRNDDGDEDSKKTGITNGAAVIRASETGATETKASAFATGSNTAVGASVAVNISLSDIKASAGDRIDAGGAVTVKAESLSEDETWAFATALGADIQRALNKFADKKESLEEGANKMTQGQYFDKMGKKDGGTGSGGKIADRLNDDRVKAEDGDEANANVNVSSNVLRSQGVKADGGEEADEAAGDAGNRVNDGAGRNDINVRKTGSETRKLQVAAAVGVTVALHNAAASAGGAILSGGNVELAAVNSGNFNTRSTAAAMSLEYSSGNTISAAVGVSVNNNKAVTEVLGDVTAKGDVSISSDLTQNLEEGFITRLPVQALSGAVSGKGNTTSIAGAVGVVISSGVSSAQVLGAKKIEGKSVAVTAHDKSKLGARAGGINISTGANIGAGVSVAVISSDNDVKASVNDGAQIIADSFELSAKKDAITWDDFQFPWKITDVFTDSSALTDEERENVYTGIIDVHRKPGETSYTVDLNLDTYALMKLFDAGNMLAFTNYYTAAIAGSLALGSSGGSANKFNGSGSFSIVRTENTVQTILGSNVTVRKRDEKATGDGVRIAANDQTTARLIGGAVAAGTAMATAGVTVTFLSDQDEAKTVIGNNVTIGADKVTVETRGDTTVQAFNAAAAVDVSSQSAATIGGAVNVLLMKNTADTAIGNNARITSGSSLDIGAGADMDLILVSVGVAGARKGVAAGGTVAYIDDEAASTVTIGDNHTLTAEKDVTVSAKTTDHLISVLASASASVTSGGLAAAGAVNVLRSAAKGVTTLGEGGKGNGIFTNEGDVVLEGSTGTRAINVTVGAAGASGVSIGLSVNADIFERESAVEIKGGNDYKIKTNKTGGLMMQAAGEDTSIIGALALAGSLGGAGISGNLALDLSRNRLRTRIEKGTVENPYWKDSEGGDDIFNTHLKDRTYVIAGSIALANAGPAVGATAVVVVKENSLLTDVGKIHVDGSADGKLAKKAAGGIAEEGIYVGATVDSNIVAGAAGAALSATAGVAANVAVLADRNTVVTDASGANLELQRARTERIDYAQRCFMADTPNGPNPRTEGTGLREVTEAEMLAYLRGHPDLDSGSTMAYVLDPSTGKYWRAWKEKDIYDSKVVTHAGNVNVIASNDVSRTLFAGGVNAGLTAGVGASVAVLVGRAEVEARAGNGEVSGDVKILGRNRDRITVLNVSAGGGATAAVEAGITVSDLGSKVTAEAAGNNLRAKGYGKISVQALNHTDMTNVAVALAGAATAAVTPVFVYTGFTGETDALAAGELDAEEIILKADSAKRVDQYTVGAAGAGTAGVSGAVSVTALRDQTAARTGALKIDGSSVKTTLEAGNDLTLRGVSGIAAGAGAAAVGVNALVTVAHSSTLAELGDGADFYYGDTLNVKAHSNRDIINGALNLNGAGAAAAGVTVMALAAGEKLDQDTADRLVYGSGGKGGTKAFDAAAVIRRLNTLGVDTSAMGSLEGDLGGNGKITDYDSLGTKKGSSRTFDADSGYADHSENMKVGESRDLQNAKNLSIGAANGEPTDSVTARIAAKTEIKRVNKILVEAEQQTLADLFGGTVGGAGTAGVGLSLTYAGLHSNVTAASLGTVEGWKGKTRSLTVRAVSGSGDAAVEAGSLEETHLGALLKEFGDKLNPTKRSIRAAGVSAGAAGIAGIGVSGGVVQLDNVTRAVLGGTVEADNVSVQSEALYRDVMAASLSAGGAGAAAVGLSVAVAESHGLAEAIVDAGASVKGTTNVDTNTVFNADAFAATVAVSGLFSGLAGVGIARNSLTQNTTVTRGASVSGELNVKAKSATSANAWLAGVSVGGVAVNIGVGIADVSAEVNTTVGLEGTGSTKLEGNRPVRIANDISSAANAALLSATGGGAGIAANVLLVFNETKAKAEAANIEGNVSALEIESGMDATVTSSIAAGTLGIFAAGVSVNYADLNAVNRAVFTTKDADLTAGKLSVIAETRKTQARASSITAELGVYSVGANVAIARNRTNTEAVLSAEGLKSSISPGIVVRSSSKNTDAKATMTGVSAGAVRIGAAVTVAMNEASSKADVRAKNPSGISLDELSSRVEGETEADLTTGTGALVNVGANVALAYGRTSSVISGSFEDHYASITAENTGRDRVKATITNMIGLNAVSAAAMVGGAYSQDEYVTRITAKNINKENNTLPLFGMRTNYETSAIADVTPSSTGVDLNFAGATVNVADAINKVKAGLEVYAENTRITAVNMTTQGKADASAMVRPATFAWGIAINVGVNRVTAEQEADQYTVLRMKNSSADNAGITMKSIMDKSDVTAVVSTSGTKKENQTKVRLGTVSVELNRAKATRKSVNTVSIIGEGGADKNIMNLRSLTLFAGNNPAQGYADTKVITNGSWQAGLVTVGGIEGTAIAADKQRINVQGVQMSVESAANLRTLSKNTATGEGGVPGGLSIVGTSNTGIRACIGTENDPQSSVITIGDDVKLKAEEMYIYADNYGKAVTSVKKGVTVSAVDLGSAQLPTDSWYDSRVVIGKGAQLETQSRMELRTRTITDAYSTLESKGVGLAFSLDRSKGVNTIHTNNLIDIGSGASLHAGSKTLDIMKNGVKVDEILPGMYISNKVWANNMRAVTELNGGTVLLDVRLAKAENTLNRVLGIRIGDGAALTSDADMQIRSVSGESDLIYTSVCIDNGGTISIGDAEAIARITVDNKITVGKRAVLSAAKDLLLEAQNTHYYTKKSGEKRNGILMQAYVDTGGLGIDPKGTAELHQQENAKVEINRNSSTAAEAALLRSLTGSITVRATNAEMRTTTYATTYGKAVSGASRAKAKHWASLDNTVWVDNASLTAAKDVTLQAQNNAGGAKPLLDIEADARLYGSGYMSGDAYLYGSATNQIRSNNTGLVKVTGNFRHERVSPASAISYSLKAKYDRFGAVYNGSATHNSWTHNVICDFCDKPVTTQPAGFVEPSDMKLLEPWPSTDQWTKYLIPVSDISTFMAVGNGITKARYGEEDYVAAGKIFVLDAAVLLAKDVLLPRERLAKYRLWTNVNTQQDVFLLPNSTRLYSGGGLRLQYVAEVIRGDVRGNGRVCDIDITVALTKYAFGNPVIPIGGAGTLDFRSGELSIPSNSDYELYLNEVSAKWMLEKLSEGFIRMLLADQAAVNACALEGADLPEGTMVEGIVPGGEKDGWKVYWLGDTPETAKAPDQTLICLRVNEATDEADAFRTSVNMLRNGEEPADVSLYLYRDSKFDRMGIEKYNCMFFDTPEGEGSLVKVVTNVLMNRKLEMPKTLWIVLRGFALEGADLPAYAISGHFFAMNDGTDGRVSMFGGVYEATYTGDVFDSPYIRIEGITDGSAVIVIKQGQPIWPEWTGPDTAEDIEGNYYIRMDDKWYRLTEGKDV